MITETRSTLEEYIPGMREQGKGIKIYVEHDFAPLKAAIVGNPGSCYMSDLNLPDFKNMLGDSKSEKELAYLREVGGQHMRDADPETFAKFEAESNALAAVLRENGVKVIRNETGWVPDELVNMFVGGTGHKYNSIWAQGGGEVMGHCFVDLHDLCSVWGVTMEHRDALLEIFKNDPEAVWLTMPMPYASRVQPRAQPFCSPDCGIFPNKICIVGIGVAEASYCKDLSKPRSASDEFGAEILRRMMKPYGWRVETVYFNSKYAYHLDVLIGGFAEGLIGLPSYLGEPALWTELPEEFRDWEIITWTWDGSSTGRSRRFGRTWTGVQNCSRRIWGLTCAK